MNQTDLPSTVSDGHGYRGAFGSIGDDVDERRTIPFLRAADFAHRVRLAESKSPPVAARESVLGAVSHAARQGGRDPARRQRIFASLAIVVALALLWALLAGGATC